MTSLYPSTALVVVDSTVKDYQGLIDSVSSNTKVLVLDAAQDGIEQITTALHHFHNLSSLHILSHGEPGALQLGNTWLSLATLERYTEQIQSWAKAITADANIFLYGCRVAAGTVGQAFVQQLSQWVSAPIAASTTLTGSTRLGGDWFLEFATGEINAPLAFAPVATAAYPHVLAVPVNLLTETFTGSDVVDKRWLFGVNDATIGQLNPFLTARNTGEAPEGGLPGNPSPGAGAYPAIDAEGSGVLRLTNNTTNQAAYVLYDNPLPASAGLIIEFDLFSYGGTGADGISFFLADGANPPNDAGGFGGSLGYAQINASFQGAGVQGGYLGVGFDEYGNYSNPTEGRVGGTAFTPDAIAVRGSQANNYAYLTGTGAGELPFSIDAPTAATREEAGRRVRIELTPTGRLFVQIDANRDGDYTDAGESPTALQNYDVIAANGEVPDTFTFGFASGTGIFTNNHEIRNLQVSQPTSPPEVADATVNVPSGTTVNVTGLSATDADGTIVSYTIATVPPADQGTLYLGDPAAGGTPVAVGQVLTPDQISQVFFQSTAGFTGATFTYNATDDIGAVDQTPGTVTLALQTNPNNAAPVANDIAAELNPSTTALLPPLTATDSDGTIASFTIVSLPSTTQGLLYLGDPASGGRLVTAGETLTPDQVGQLYLQAEPDFTGGNFTFYATDNLGGISNVATFTLDNPTVNSPPVANNGTAELNPDATTRLPELIATDPDGTVASFTIASLPPAGQGRLYLGNPDNGGRLVEAGETLTPDQVGRLFFQAEPDFTGGTFTFYATDNLGSTSNTATFTLDDSTGLDPDNPNDGTCEPGIRRRGTGGNNSIRGTGDIDTLLGGAGNDTLNGLNCPDILEGNQGNDVIFGGNAADVLNGGLGRDRLNGDNGNDQLFGRRGNDTLDGGRGNDHLFGLIGNDRINGRAGIDYLVGGLGNDTLNGGGNNDVIEGRQNRDQIAGNGGDDSIYGNLGIDTITGANGNDSIYGGKGNDRIKGNAGADFLNGQRSNDRVHGGSQADYIFGDEGNDTLIGGGGADTLNGSLGNDRFVFRNVTHGGDLIEGFQLGDVFDFSAIFNNDGYTRTGTFDYIQQIQSGADIIVQIDSNGNQAGGFINYLTIQASTSSDLAGVTQLAASNFIV